MVYIAIVAVLALSDLLIKRRIQKKYVDNKTKSMLNDNVVIKNVHNRGCMMGWLKEKKKLIDFSSVLVLGSIVTVFFQTLIKKGMKIKKVGLAILLAGAISNVYERIFKGFVVDYINLKKCKVLKKIVFNLADVFIFIGGLIALIHEIFCGEK